MPDSEEVERKICKTLLNMGDEETLARLEAALKGLDERNRRISDTLEELLHEVDKLLLKMDEIENNRPEITREDEL